MKHAWQDHAWKMGGADTKLEGRMSLGEEDGDP